VVLESPPRVLTDHDVDRTQAYIQGQWLPTVPDRVVRKAIDLCARDQTLHPVRDYLSALQWDGQGRVDRWLSRYLGAAHTLYTRAVGRWFLIGMVARICDPGCKLDYTLVLEGPQGSRKSTACRILGGAWFSDSLPDLRQWWGPQEHLKGKWLIEIAELAAIRGANAEQLKAFLSRSVEQYHPRQGNAERIEPRQCAFIATTNRADYLKDATGARRFWPVRCGWIDTGGLESDRDQLFAETVHLYQHGKRWWPASEFERRVIVPEQEARAEVDPWQSDVQAYLDDNSLAKVTIKLVLQHALHEHGRSRANSNRVVDILQRLGWRRSTTKSHGDYYWLRGVNGGLLADRQAKGGA
jgi:predicted P-loop ATPase